MNSHKANAANEKFRNNPYRIGKNKTNRIVSELQGKRSVNTHEYRVLHTDDKSTESIVRYFPQLSNIFESRGEQVCYNADIALFIPKGRRCLFWFTIYENQNICYVIDCMYVNSNLTAKINRNSYFAIQSGFDTTLCHGAGTILRGTHTHINNKPIGAIEDMYYYKGVNIQSQSLLERMKLLKDIFTYEIGQQRYFEKQCILAMCVVVTGNTEPADIIRQANALPYPVKFVQFRYDTRHECPIVNIDPETYNNYIMTQNSNHYNPNANVYSPPPPPPPPPPPLLPPAPSTLNVTRNSIYPSRNIRSENRPNINYNNDNNNVYRQHQPHNQYHAASVNELVFIVTPSLQNDIYLLHTYSQTDQSQYKFHGYAGIQSYDTSVMMNRLFRNIKENDNLDALEESDDDDEFENTSPDKYVNLDKNYRMVCKYMQKINKWVPLRIANNGQRVATQQDTYGLGASKSM